MNRIVIREDWANHIILSLVLFLLGAIASQAAGFDPMWQCIHGASFSLAVGAGKEMIYDRWMGKGTPSWADFGADCVGVGLAVACRFPF